MSVFEFVPTASRDEWLAERRKGVTATDIAKIAEGQPAKIRGIRADKLGLSEPIGDNQYFRWGRQREAVMAGLANFEHDVVPNNIICRSKIDSRWLATPDAISEDCLRIGEFKTVTLERNWTAADIPQLYQDQVQWQLFVTGARSCVFCWEPHDDFQPLAIQATIIWPDLKRIEKLVDFAERFWESLSGDSDDEIAQSLFLRYKGLKEEQTVVNDELAALEQEIIEKLPAGYSDGRWSVSPPKPYKKTFFDSKAFKEEHGDLFALYAELKTVSLKKPRITIKKGGK